MILKTGVLMLCLLSIIPREQLHAQTASAPNQKRTTKPSSLPEEDRLRIRLQFHPHDAEAHKRLVTLLEKKYAFRAIVTEDATWVKNNSNDWFALTQLVSYSKVALDDPEFAIAQLHSYLASVSRKDDPEHYDDVTDQLAGELQERGRPEESLPLLADVVRLNPNEAGFWADYAGVLSDLGRKDEAVHAWHRSIELNPSMFHEGLADALLRFGDLSGAGSEYRAELSIYQAQYKTGEPTDSFHSMIKGMVKIEAEHYAEHALAETRLKLAHVLLLDKKYDEAIAQTQAALDADHTAFAALYLCAEIYDAKGDHDQATRTRDEATTAINKQAASEGLAKKASNSGDPRVLFLNDTLWNKQSGYPAFPSEIVSILEPRVAQLAAIERIELAMAYFALGRVMEAKQQWEKAIAADPKTDTAVAHANLGRELLKAGNVKDALPHLQRAYELDPQNVTFRMDYETARRRRSLTRSWRMPKAS
jgi:tetratricopeptide (TPR) repeat protein